MIPCVENWNFAAKIFNLEKNLTHTKPLNLKYKGNSAVADGVLSAKYQEGRGGYGKGDIVKC